MSLNENKIISHLNITENENLFKNYSCETIERFLNNNKLNNTEIYHVLKYPILFHKFILNLVTKNKLTYEVVNNNVQLQKKNICHIHCFKLSNLHSMFGEYIGLIQQNFDIIVTFCVGYEELPLFDNILYIYVDNIGYDIGPKFCVCEYLCNINYDYNYIMCFHSKSNDHQRKKYLSFFSKNFDKIYSFLNTSNIGGLFPNMLYFGSSKLNKLGDLPTHKNWGRNKIYMDEISKYFNINNNDYLFSEGNYYILSKSIFAEMFNDTLLYNILNNTDSFDYSWVNIFYNLNKPVEDVYKIYKELEYYGNNLHHGKGHAGLADCMIEHIFERIPMSLCNKNNLKYYLIDENSDITLIHLF